MLGVAAYNNPAAGGSFRPFISVWWLEKVISTHARQAVFLLWLFGPLGGDGMWEGSIENVLSANNRRNKERG